MKPNEKLISISNNIEQIKLLLSELVLQPRINAVRWSRITKQTPNMKIGYPGQHLASLITGMTGERTGARGNDLIDGSEVKSCSRIDQSDKCLDCGNNVSRFELECSSCNSTNIRRNNDSKWLFSIRTESELELITKKVDRVLLVIADYSNFEEKDYEAIRFQSYEIWPKAERHKFFVELLNNYYYKIYQGHKTKNPSSNPAPKNFWPYQYQFYMCNPILTFSCTVYNSNTKPEIQIEHYVEPNVDRATIASVTMPTKILKPEEWKIISANAQYEEIYSVLKPEYQQTKQTPNIKDIDNQKKNLYLIGIDERLRNYLILRDTDKISNSKSLYSRRLVEGES